MFSEKVSRVRPLPELVASVAGPREWSDNRKSWLARAAKRAGISFRQAKALFYGEIVDPNHKSARLMRDAAEQYEQVAQRLATTDADFFGEDIRALLDLARQVRGLAGTRGRGD